MASLRLRRFRRFRTFYFVRLMLTFNLLLLVDLAVSYKLYAT